MRSKSKWLFFALIALFLIGVYTIPASGHPKLGVTNFDAVHLHCVDCGTATPVFVVDQSSGSDSGLAFEVRGDSTPVFSISKAGVLNVQGGQIVTQALTYVIVNAPTAIGTATPAVLINNAGVSNLLEVRDSATPVFIVGQNGAWSSTGLGTHTGGQSIAPNLIVAAPTSIGTATPAAIVNSAGGVSNIFEARAASTPQVVVGPSGILTLNAGSLNNAFSKVAAPTAIATQTPAAVVDSAGVSNLLELRANATPQLSVSKTGVVTGKVEQSDQSGVKCVYGTQTVTGTGTIAHGLSTPVAVQVSLAQTMTVNGGLVSYANSAGVVTAQVWQIPATPGAVAATTPVAVSYRVCGTP